VEVIILIGVPVLTRRPWQEHRHHHGRYHGDCHGDLPSIVRLSVEETAAHETSPERAETEPEGDRAGEESTDGSRCELRGIGWDGCLAEPNGKVREYSARDEALPVAARVSFRRRPETPE
jgi:hypothetical protein